MRRWILPIVLLLLTAALVLAHGNRLEQLPKNRVEVLTEAPAAVEALCAGTDALPAPVWEEGRWVWESPDLFTAQRLETALTNGGVEAVVLDYSWAEDVLRQSGQLWMAVSAFCVLGFLILGGQNQARLEARRLRQAGKHQYLREYLYDSSVLLLGKLIVGVFLGIVAVVLVRRLLAAPVYLPCSLLPQGSLFQPAHYQQWAAETFPTGAMSPSGLQLLAMLKVSYLFAALETLCIVLLTAAVWHGVKRSSPGKSDIS